MFPKTINNLKEPQDINNLLEYKRQKPREPQAKISLETEFQLLKNELCNPDPNKFLLSNESSPSNKYIKMIRQASKEVKATKKRRETKWIVAGTYYSHISTERRTVCIAKREQPKLLIRRIAGQILDKQDRSAKNIKKRLNPEEFVTNRIPLKLNESCDGISKKRLVFLRNYKINNTKTIEHGLLIK